MVYKKHTSWRLGDLEPILNDRYIVPGTSSAAFSAITHLNDSVLQNNGFILFNTVGITCV